MTVDGNPCRRKRYSGRGRSVAGLNRRANRRVAGFTLLEILVAMAVAAFGVLGFAALLKAIGNVEAEDTWETKALFCAQERLEELKYACMTDKAFTGEGAEIVAEGSYQGMRREWGIEDSPVFEGLLEVRVGCGYPWKGTMEMLELATLIYVEE